MITSSHLLIGYLFKSLRCVPNRTFDTINLKGWLFSRCQWHGKQHIKRWHRNMSEVAHTVYPKKYAHGFCFAVLCCGYTLTDFPISIRLTNDCPSASKATLMNMDKYFMWIHYERLHNHNKAKHNKAVCIFLGIYSRDSRMRGSFLEKTLLLPLIISHSNIVYYTPSNLKSC